MQVKKWEQLEFKTPEQIAKAKAFFSKMGFEAQVQATQWGSVSEIILTSKDGTSLRINSGPSLYRELPETKMEGYVEGEIKGLKVKETFPSKAEAETRYDELVKTLHNPDDAKLEWGEREVEVA